MPTSKDGAFVRQLDTLFNVGVIRELTDGQLLERFATGTGEAAELAFAALVERHGPMVLRACRAQLGDVHDTQDAFQATFLILVKKARGLWVRDSLGPWLYQVAFRTAACARLAAARRRRHEQRAAEIAAGVAGHEDRTDSSLERLLHSEIHRLPERYRVPIVLCDLQGHTCEEAARRMGRPVGTVKSWRARGRERLRARLIRLGLAPSAAAAAALAPDAALAAVPARHAEQTLRLAVRFTSRRMTSGEVPASVRTLVNGVIMSMLVGKLRTTAVTVIAAALLAAGVGSVARVGAEAAMETGDTSRGDAAGEDVARQHPPHPSPSEGAQEIWSLTLRDAISIGLDNGEGVRLIKTVGKDPRDDELVVAAVNPDVDAQQFRANIMAHVRSIEERYWSLAQQHAQLWSGERAVELAEEIKKREQSDLERGRGDEADVAEATQRLEQFRLDLLTKTSDVITTERQLRNILGLPPADNRRIVPITAPIESHVEPDWESCRAAMLENHPEIVRAKAAADLADRARRSDQVERQKATRLEVIRDATHSLARFFLEVDAGYKQFKTASRLRAEARQRLDRQRALFDEGRLTIDRYLDAVSQHASATAQEAQFRTGYNLAIVALEEAKGTLLAYNKINVTKLPMPGSLVIVNDEEAGASPVSRSFTFRAAPALPAHPETTVARAKDEALGSDPAGKTISFQFTIGRGSRPLEVRGSFTVTPASTADSPTVQSAPVKLGPRG